MHLKMSAKLHPFLSLLNELKYPLIVYDNYSLHGIHSISLLDMIRVRQFSLLESLTKLIKGIRESAFPQMLIYLIDITVL